MPKLSFRLLMACHYTGASAVVFLVALLTKAPPALLWFIAGLLVWFAKGLWQYRHDMYPPKYSGPAQCSELTEAAAEEKLRTLLYRSKGTGGD